MTQAAVEGSQPKVRRGSFLSDKQVVEASRRGRHVTFKVLKSQPAHEVVGYVVGMDDYHWMVACPQVIEVVSPRGEDLIKIRLVHKSADLIELDTKNTLDSLSVEHQDAIKKIGESFWASQSR